MLSKFNRVEGLHLQRFGHRGGVAADRDRIHPVLIKTAGKHARIGEALPDGPRNLQPVPVNPVIRDPRPIRRIFPADRNFMIGGAFQFQFLRRSDIRSKHSDRQKDCGKT